MDVSDSSKLEKSGSKRDLDEKTNRDRTLVLTGPFSREQQLRSMFVYGIPNSLSAESIETLASLLNVEGYALGKSRGGYEALKLTELKVSVQQNSLNQLRQYNAQDAYRSRILELSAKITDCLRSTSNNFLNQAPSSRSVVDDSDINVEAVSREFKELPSSLRVQVIKEIQTFRKIALEHEKSKMSEIENIDAELRSSLEKKTNDIIDSVKEEVEEYHFSSDEENDKSDETLLQETVSAQLKEQEHLFQKRLMRYKDIEKSRLESHRYNMTRKAHHREEQGAASERLIAKLSQFDDDSEAEKGTDQYYTDFESWYRNRREFREKEKARDEKILAEREERFTRTQSEETPVNTEASHEHGDVLDETIDWKQISDVEWKDIHEFIVKVVLEYFGVDETEFVEFIMEQLRSTPTLEVLREQLNMVFEEDTDTQLVKIWTKLHEILKEKTS
ncbi:hypothetical protein CANCADRAFT_44652 [Tortispora caseinolytica NRRL Y-17796]|uniref:U1 small nuclear ribonucleoprotein component SNU71 n=1 Tax=Tortispora caseinolytica NRRL Y-17796 TaxID=767744 RepID=A0A1E4TGZ4_9ASCO|nr:hypothetical protein CANCADRAFT_44652 [Tortispora caseinolytica NRRL Y-17796]